MNVSHSHLTLIDSRRLALPRDQPVEIDAHAEPRSIVRVELAILERQELVEIRDRLRAVVVFEDDGLRIWAERVYLGGCRDRAVRRSANRGW